MNLPTHGSETSLFPSSLDGVFARFAGSGRESACRLAGGAERSNIDYSLKMSEILSSAMKPSDTTLSHEWDAIGRPHSSAMLSYSALPHARLASWSHRLYSAGLPHSAIQHENSSAFSLSVEEMNSLWRPYGAANKLYEFSHHSIPTELASFEGLMDALQMLGFNESAEEIEMLSSPDDIDDGDEPLSLESVRGFVKLMDAFRDLGEPMVGRFSAGTLSVEWRIADDRHLLVEPLDSGNASFAFIGPSLTSGANRFRLNGRGKIADVVDALRNNKVDKWRAW